jgi:anaerobic selenocysteine-containing dehydrogenase
MSDSSRRNFIKGSAQIIAGAAAMGALGVAQASSHGGNKAKGAVNGLAVAASTQDTCGTCEFWGGMRKVSKDKSSVIAQSMGWCNNSESKSYQTLTPADKKMQMTGIWKKWAAL